MAELYSRTDIYDLFQTDEYEEGIRKHWEVIRSKTGIFKAERLQESGRGI